MQLRDWTQAASFFGPDTRVHWPVTDETFVGQQFIAMNQAYPEGWNLEVAETIDQGQSVAARVRVDHVAETVWCAGFYVVSDGRISEAVEYWSTEGGEQAPDWRAEFRDY